MSAWEPCAGATDDWYTPKFLFDALAQSFDLDVAAPGMSPPTLGSTKTASPPLGEASSG